MSNLNRSKILIKKKKISKKALGDIYFEITFEIFSYILSYGKLKKNFRKIVLYITWNTCTCKNQTDFYKFLSSHFV